LSAASSSNHDNTRGVRRSRSGEELPSGSSRGTISERSSRSLSHDSADGLSSSRSRSKSRRRRDRSNEKQQQQQQQRRRRDPSPDIVDTTVEVDTIVAASNAEDSTDGTADLPDDRGLVRRPSADLKRIVTERKGVRRYKSGEDLNPMAIEVKRSDSLIVSAAAAAAAAGGTSSSASQRGTTRRQFRAQRRTSSSCEESVETESSQEEVVVVAAAAVAKPNSTGDLSTSLRHSRRSTSTASTHPTPIAEEEVDSEENSTEDRQQQVNGVSSSRRTSRRGSGGGSGPKDADHSTGDYPSSSRRAHRRGSGGGSGLKQHAKEDADANDPISAALQKLGASTTPNDKSIDDDGTITTARNRRGRRRNEMEQALRQHRKEDSGDDGRQRSPSPQRRVSKSPVRRNGDNTRSRRRGGTKQHEVHDSNDDTAALSAEHVYERPRALSKDFDDVGILSQESEDETLGHTDDDYDEQLAIPSSVRIHLGDESQVPQSTLSLDGEFLTTAAVPAQVQETEAEEAQSKPASRSLFQNLLGRGKGKSKENETIVEEPGEIANDESPSNDGEACIEEASEEKATSKATLFKNMLGGLKNRSKDTNKEDNAPSSQDQEAQQNAIEVTSETSQSIRSTVDDAAMNEAISKPSTTSRINLKGLLSRATKGSPNDAEAETKCEDVETQESVVVAAAAETAKSVAEGTKSNNKWKGLRSGLDFTTRLKITQTEKSKKAQQTELQEVDSERSLEFEATESSNTHSDHTDAVTSEENNDATTAKSKRTAKWNFAAKLKKNLQQESKSKSEKETLKKKDKDDDKIPTDYGLMNSVTSFSDEDLADLVETASKDTTKDLEQSPAAKEPHARPKMDRRMMMGGFQGKSTKFDFSKESQDSAIATRQSKEEAEAEIHDSCGSSSLNLDDANSSIDTINKDKSAAASSGAVDAFSLLSSSASSSSNPPERRMVFANTLLREPSQRFDFEKKPVAAAPLETQDMIEEGDESEDEEEEENELVKIPVKEEVNPVDQAPSPRLEFKSLEAELLRAVEKKKSRRRKEGEKEGRKVSKDLERELKRKVSLSKSVASSDGAERNTAMDTAIATTADTDVTEQKGEPFTRTERTSFFKYPKLSSTECVQLDFGLGETPVVCIHSLYEDDETDEKEGGHDEHFLLLESAGKTLEMQDLWGDADADPSTSTATTSASITPATSDASSSSPSLAHERLLRELSDSEKRTRQAQETVRIMEKELQSKRRRYAELDARRQANLSGNE
jgi:hypothetical protein